MAELGLVETVRETEGDDDVLKRPAAELRLNRGADRWARLLRVRSRENRRARGAFNRIIAEANHFGMVNAYVHTLRAAEFGWRMLSAVGAPALPPVTVVVGAHFGSNLPGYAAFCAAARTRARSRTGRYAPACARHLS